LEVLALSLAFSIAPSLMSQASSASECKVEKGYYHCDRGEFLAALKDAKTVQVDSKPFDTATTNSLSKLVRTLKKTEVTNSPDLSLVLVRSQAEGIFYGPSQRELASLLVYSGSSRGSDRKLIWIETFDGEPDLVWPIVVFDIIKQFKSNLN
jgi:hypothetical protein